jgi:hypothetical protein
MVLRSFPDFPYQPCFHDVLGARMAVVDEGSGDGPPLVLLHGNPTWSYLWRKVIPVLAPARRVIAPDLVGHGRSGKPDIGYRLADHVTRVHLGNGGHFVPDQHGTALGHAIRGWLSDHR